MLARLESNKKRKFVYRDIALTSEVRNVRLWLCGEKSNERNESNGEEEGGWKVCEQLTIGPFDVYARARWDVAHAVVHGHLIDYSHGDKITAISWKRRIDGGIWFRGWQEKLGVRGRERETRGKKVRKTSNFHTFLFFLMPILVSSGRWAEAGVVSSCLRVLDTHCSRG